MAKIPNSCALPRDTLEALETASSSDYYPKHGPEFTISTSKSRPHCTLAEWDHVTVASILREKRGGVNSRSSDCTHVCDMRCIIEGNGKVMMCMREARKVFM